MASNTAIFYDIENLMGIFNGKTNTGLHLDEIYRRVLAMDGVNGVSIQRAYADWAVPMYRNLRNSVLQVGIEPIQIFNTNQNDRVKNAADVSLIIDAVDLAARRPEIENFVIASGDGIFAFLSKKLHEHGKYVIGCSFEKIANIIFRNSCDSFIALEKADESIVVTSTKRNTTPAAASVTAPVAAEKPLKNTSRKKSQQLPKTKYTETLLATDIPRPQDINDTSGVMHMVRQMVDALFVESTSDLPGLEISIFANYISHYLPEFKVRSLRFKGIGEFMRFMLTGSEYCTYSVNDNVVLMAPRKAAEAVNGKIVADVNGLLIVTSENERFNSVFNVPEGTAFVYTVQKNAVPKVQKPTTKKPKATTNQQEAIISSSEEADSVRKLAKIKLVALSKENVLPADEVTRLTTRQHSLATFGVRAPILKEIDSNDDMRSQRLLNGKVKYWKEPFEFNGKQYLVFKEWTNLHKERILAWCAQYQTQGK